MPFLFAPPLSSRLLLPQHDGEAVFTLLADALLDAGRVVQAWTDLPHGEWHPVDFELVPEPEHADFSLAPPGPAPTATYEARIAYRTLERPAYSFTYRIHDSRDGSVRWLGDEHSNGSLVRADPGRPFLLPSPDGWTDDPHVLGARAWQPSLRADVARFGHASDLHTARGFAITHHSDLFPFRLAGPTFSLTDDHGPSSASHQAAAPLTTTPLVLLALFPAAERPFFIAGEDLALQPAAENPRGDYAFVLHASSPATLRRDFDAAACIKPLSGIDLLDTNPASFVALYSRAHSKLAVIPTSPNVAARSIVRIQDLSRTLQHSVLALHCTASKCAIFLRGERSLDVLVSSDGGECTLAPAHTGPDGELVSVMVPSATLVTSTPLPKQNGLAPVDERVNPRSVALRRGVLSLPALCAVACFLLTTFLRLLPRLAPVRLALSLSERLEHFLYEHMFGIQTTAPRKVSALAPNGKAPVVVPNELLFSLPPRRQEAARGERACIRVMLQMSGRERGRRSADALPRFFFGDTHASPRIEATATTASSAGEAPVTILEFDRPPSDGDTLRVVF